jgi:hypothetical protein
VNLRSGEGFFSKLLGLCWKGGRDKTVWQGHLLPIERSRRRRQSTRSEPGSVNVRLAPKATEVLAISCREQMQHLLDHLVGAGEHAGRHLDAQRFGSRRRPCSGGSVRPRVIRDGTLRAWFRAYSGRAGFPAHLNR